MTINKSMPTDSLTVKSITTDKFKTGALALLVRTKNEPLCAPYSLLMCEILRSATEKYPTKAKIAKRLYELYAASVGIKAMKEGAWRVFAFSAEILDEKYSTDGTDITDGIGEMLEQFMYAPLLDGDGLFPEATFEQEKKRVVTYLRSIINNPPRYASMRLSDLIARHKEDHLDLPSLIKTIEECDRKTLFEFYKKTVRSHPIEAFYMGSLSHGEIEKKLLCRFGGFKAKSNPEKDASIPKIPERDAAYLDEDMPVNQGRLAIAFRTGISPDQSELYASILMNEIFGGGASSKLFMNVREKMSLCYSCSSTLEMDRGIIHVSSGIDPQNREIAQKAILEEFENIKEGKISEYEFSSAKKALENSYREIYDNPFDIFAFYSSRDSLGIECSIDECREKISAVTLRDVIKVANNTVLDSVYFLNGTAAVEGGEDGEDE